MWRLPVFMIAFYCKRPWTQARSQDAVRGGGGTSPVGWALCK